MAARGLTDLSVERGLLSEGFDFVIGVDEVGRGALAGPVSVGVALFDLRTLTAAEVPAGIHDSKQLSAQSRQEATDRVRSWAAAAAVGSTTPAELDEVGMTMALNLAGRRAMLSMLHEWADASVGEFPGRTMVLLDGRHDWLSAPLTLDTLGIFGDCADLELPPVRTVIKGDGSVPAIAAASIVAKVARDETMIALAEAHPHYGWESNVGYGTAKHRQGITELGPSIHHRRSFRLSADTGAKEGLS
ncbi:RNase HII [Brevibacterium siliguriense]|uniref:Ribonuclease n=1 Tax=Brevibacterium siliguriense TaxID=1136497 RepID=A0A1H1S569_9MICO|nr:ribonuclease HII [Brevibacterium siliguriense]SDS42918.1 RNase HII [Brevibacterium siliguriense]